VKRVFITGMSGTGKSTVIARLAALGHRAIDTDSDEYFELVEPDDAVRARFGDAKDWRWRVDRITALLDAEDAPALFLSGTSSNQAQFYPRFDHVVLLSAPEPIVLARLRTRTTNRYAKDPAELARELHLRPIVEPMLRRAADIEVDTSAPLDDVVARIAGLVS
jgi:dephospho-CoA kinase